MQKIISKLAKELNLSVAAVENAYKAYWLFIREKIKDLPLKKNMTEEEFNYLKTNFNLPSMGKLNCTYDRWERLHNAKGHTYDNNEYQENTSDG